MLQLSRRFRAVSRTVWVTGIVCVSMILCDVTQAEETGLEFLDQTRLEQSTGTQESVTIAVRNNTVEARDLKFRIETHNKNEIETIHIDTISPTPATLEAHEIKFFTLTITSPKKPASGYLVVTAQDGKASAGYRPLAFVAPDAALFLPAGLVNSDRLVVAGLVGASLLFVVMILLASSSGAYPWNYLLVEPPDWSKGSWVTNITALIALVNLVFTPSNAEEPLRYLSADQYKGLGLLFAALVLAAPLIYSLTSKPYTVQSAVNEKNTGLRGYVGWFLLSSAILFGGACGQWLLTALAVDELRVAGILSNLASIVLGILLLVAAILFVLFTVPSLLNQVDAHWRNTPSPQHNQTAAETTGAEPPKQGNQTAAGTTGTGSSINREKRNDPPATWRLP